MMLYIGGFGTTEMLMIAFLAIIPLLIWLWALIDVLKSNFKDNTVKILWVLVIILLPVLGCILYLIIGRSQRLTT